MIEGLKFKVTRQELQVHLRARADYHSKRADTKEAEIPKLQQILETVAPQKAGLAQIVSNKSRQSYNFDPEDQIENIRLDILSHRNTAAAFAWMADHLFDEDYELQESDLRRLELLK